MNKIIWRRILASTLAVLLIAIVFYYLTISRSIDSAFSSLETLNLDGVSKFIDTRAVALKMGADSARYFSDYLESISTRDDLGIQFAKARGRTLTDLIMVKASTPDGFIELLKEERNIRQSSPVKYMRSFERFVSPFKIIVRFTIEGIPDEGYEHEAEMSLHFPIWRITNLVSPDHPSGARVIDPNGGALPEGVTNVDTFSGRIRITQCSEKEVLNCEQLLYQDTKLHEDFNIKFVNVFPRTGKSQIVLVSTYGGGTCCLPFPILVDASTSPPVMFKDMEGAIVGKYQEAIAPAGPGLFLIRGWSPQDTDATDKYGNPLPIYYLYDERRRLLMRTPYDGSTDYAKFVGLHPETLLADPDGRKPLVTLLGDNYKDFRVHLDVSDHAELLDYRYIVASGCSAHSCGLSGGAFFIDIAKGVAGAVWVDDGHLSAAGSAWQPGSVEVYLKDWLSHYNLSRNSVLPACDSQEARSAIADALHNNGTAGIATLRLLDLANVSDISPASDTKPERICEGMATENVGVVRIQYKLWINSNNSSVMVQVMPLD